jgi:hypothetical protein
MVRFENLEYMPKQPPKGGPTHKILFQEKVTLLQQINLTVKNTGGRAAGSTIWCFELLYLVTHIFGITETTMWAGIKMRRYAQRRYDTGPI